MKWAENKKNIQIIVIKMDLRILQAIINYFKIHHYKVKQIKLIVKVNSWEKETIKSLNKLQLLPQLELTLPERNKQTL